MATEQDNAAFLEDAIALKYGVHNGKPLVSSEFADQNKGYIGTVSAPTGYHRLAKEGRHMICAGLMEYVQNRVGQNSKPKNAAEYQAAIDAALASTDVGSPREKDAVAAAVKAELTARVLDVKADATDAELTATIAANGPTFMEKHRDRLIAEGFRVAKRDKKKAAAAATIAVTLD